MITVAYIFSKNHSRLIIDLIFTNLLSVGSKGEIGLDLDYDIVGQNENEFYATKSQAILILGQSVEEEKNKQVVNCWGVIFRSGTTFYFLGKRRIYATVIDSLHIRSSVLVGIITSSLTWSSGKALCFNLYPSTKILSFVFVRMKYI